MKKCVEMRETLFKNWKLLFEYTNQTPLDGSKALDRRRDRIEARSKARSSGEIKRHDAIGAELRSTRLVWSGACDCQTRARDSPATSKAWSRLPLLPLVRALSLCASDLEIIWSENFHFKPFLGSKSHFIRSTLYNFQKIYFSNVIKHLCFWKNIFKNNLKSKQSLP